MVNIYVFAILLIFMSYLTSADNEKGEKLCKKNEDCGSDFVDEKPWCLKGKCEGYKNDSDCKRLAGDENLACYGGICYSDVCTKDEECTSRLKYEKPMCIGGKCKGCKNEEDCKSLFGGERPGCYYAACYSDVCNVSSETPDTDYCKRVSDWKRPMCVGGKCQGCDNDDDCVRMLGPQVPLCGNNKEVNARSIHSCFERQCPPDSDCLAFCNDIFGKARSKWNSGTASCVECRFENDCLDKEKPVCKRWGAYQPGYKTCIPGECNRNADCKGKDGKTHCDDGKCEKP